VPCACDVPLDARTTSGRALFVHIDTCDTIQISILLTHSSYPLRRGGILRELER